MKLRRFFHAELPENGGAVVVSKETAEHIRVVRIQVGEQVAFFDGNGNTCLATLKKISEAETQCLCEPVLKTKKKETTDLQPHLVQPQNRGQALHLVQAIPKGRKFDDILRMCTEVGVHAVHLVWSERSIPKNADASVKTERWNRIAMEAARQSGRTHIPQVFSPKKLIEVLKEIPNGENIFYGCPHEGMHVQTLASQTLAKQTLAKQTTLRHKNWILIGPEGGWSDEEINLFKNKGAMPLSIGEYTLRTETAAVVACALLLNFLDRKE